MAVYERGTTTPGEIGPRLPVFEGSKSQNKYFTQVGLKDLGFDVNQDALFTLNLPSPFQTINQAEIALQNHAIHPVAFTEIDNTVHSIMFFDPRPVGYSGFMDCAIHSLGLTNHGLFEIGRYPASPGYVWQWFLHRRLAEPDQINDWCVDNDRTADEFMKRVQQAMID